jgi:hypothetical protein
VHRTRSTSNGTKGVNLADAARHSAGCRIIGRSEKRLLTENKRSSEKYIARHR